MRYVIIVALIFAYALSGCNKDKVKDPVKPPTGDTTAPVIYPRNYTVIGSYYFNEHVEFSYDYKDTTLVDDAVLTYYAKDSARLVFNRKANNYEDSVIDISLRLNPDGSASKEMGKFDAEYNFHFGVDSIAFKSDYFHFNTDHTTEQHIRFIGYIRF